MSGEDADALIYLDQRPGHKAVQHSDNFDGNGAIDRCTNSSEVERARYSPLRVMAGIFPNGDSVRTAHESTWGEGFVANTTREMAAFYQFSTGASTLKTKYVHIKPCSTYTACRINVFRYMERQIKQKTSFDE